MLEPSETTRVIVFTQWRDSVTEIVRLLEATDVGIRVAPFIGQVFFIMSRA